MIADVAVIVLTYNEEQNLAQALRSVAGWARQVFVLDSFSTDRTLEVAQAYGSVIVQHPFENYARQRNFALEQLPIEAAWVLFLDADEWLPDDLKAEIGEVIATNPPQNGFQIKRRLIWMGRWIRRGRYPLWILRLFRRGKARCEERAVNEHLVVDDNAVGYLRRDFIHEDRKGIGDWIDKHNRYAAYEAEELLKQADHAGYIDASLFGDQAQRKRWVRHRIWNHLPPLLRPLLYFLYRYILMGGFLEGRPALVYHFLQALWFPFLIDVKYLELRQGRAPGQETG